MDILETSFSGVPLLTIVGEADDRLRLEEAASRAVGSHGNHVLLDLRLCPYLDSGSLSAMIGLVQQVGPTGWVGVVHCSHMVPRLLELVGLTACDNFRVFQTLDEAEAAVA